MGDAAGMRDHGTQMKREGTQTLTGPRQRIDRVNQNSSSARHANRTSSLHAAARLSSVVEFFNCQVVQQLGLQENVVCERSNTLRALCVQEVMASGIVKLHSVNTNVKKEGLGTIFCGPVQFKFQETTEITRTRPYRLEHRCMPKDHSRMLLG